MTPRNHSIFIIVIMTLVMIIASLPAQAEECLVPDGCAQAQGLSEADIAAYPSPNIEALPVDENLLYDRYYQQANSKFDIFDAPGGNVIGSLDAGFNFVTTLKVQDGWAEINSGQWVQAENLKDSGWVVSHFSGVLLPEEGLAYPMAWALVNFYPSRQPGGEPDESQPIVWRYTRLNLYSSVQAEDGTAWYQIGVDQWVHQFHVAKIIPVERPAEVDTNLWVSVDLYEQVLVAYMGNRPVMATLIASGLPQWETYEGLFHIYFRRERKNMSGGEVGADFYFLEEVPWTMFFDEGRALHGAYWHDGFGYRRSHGCVNMSITDAHWLYQWVADEMGSHSSADKENGPAVYVYSSGQY